MSLISRRIWLYWWWDRLFSNLFTLLRLDRLTLLHRPPRVSPMELIGTRRKVTGGHFAPSGPGLNLIDVNGGSLFSAPSKTKFDDGAKGSPRRFSAFTKPPNASVRTLVENLEHH